MPFCKKKILIWCRFNLNSIGPECSEILQVLASGQKVVVTLNGSLSSMLWNVIAVALRVEKF